MPASLHVRFFVERYYSDALLDDGEEEFYNQMWILYPSAMESAAKIKDYIEKFIIKQFRTMKLYT